MEALRRQGYNCDCKQCHEKIKGLKKQRLTKVDRAYKVNKALMDTFLVAQEESRQELP